MSSSSHNSQVSVNPWLVAFIVSIATFMEVLDTTITNVSLSHISGNLGSSYDESTWVLTSYLVSNGIILPISGWLSNVIGRKRFFMMCIVGFTAASFACGTATSLPMLVLFRLIQGLAGGGLQPTQQAIILDVFPPHQRAAAFGITGITMIAAPIIGPTLGGWITDNYSWRWIFYINVPFGMIALLLVNRFVHESSSAPVTKGSASIDYIGLSLISLGLGSLQIVLDKGQQEEWFDSNFILLFATVSFSCLVSAIFWLLSRKEPIIELRLFKDKGFAMGFTMIFIMGFILYSSSLLIPLMVQNQFGYDAMLAGLVISPGGLIVIVMMPIAGKLSSYIHARYLVMLGFAFISIGLWYSSNVNPATDYETLVLFRMAQVIGLPFLFIPISTIAFGNVPKELNNKASALYSMARNLGGSVGIALTTAYIARHQQIHQNYLSDTISDYDPLQQSKVTELTNYIISLGGDPTSASDQAISTFYSQLGSQAAFLAYYDAYKLLMIIALLAMFFALFSPKNNLLSKKAPAAVH